MRVAVWDARGSIEVVDKALPELEPGWVRLQVASCGICGSDLHDFRGGGGVAGRTPGHEVAGHVTGAGAAALPAGTLAALEPIDSCGHCPCCMSGHYNRCAHGELFGLDRPGGFAEYLDVPAQRLHPLPAGLDVGIAALAEPLAVAVRAARLARLDLGARVAVLGGGTIGLLSVVAARAGGAGSIHVTARYPHQAELARALGADEAFADIDAMHSATGDRAYDVVIETVGGHAHTIREAVRVADAGGTIVMVGVFDDETPLPALDFLSKELILVGSNCYALDADRGDFALATALLLQRRDGLAAMLTHRFSLDEIRRGFDTAMDKSTGVIKVQIQPA